MHMQTYCGFSDHVCSSLLCSVWLSLVCPLSILSPLACLIVGFAVPHSVFPVSWSDSCLVMFWGFFLLLMCCSLRDLKWYLFFFISSPSVRMAKSMWRTPQWRNALIHCFTYRASRRTPKVKLWKPVWNGTHRTLLVFCLSLFGLLESHFFFSCVINDEIWVVSVQYLSLMNHNYS